MRTFRVNRMVWTATLSVALIAVGVSPELFSDEPCYGVVDENTVCPNLTATGSCEDQGDFDLEACAFGDLVYHSRTTGPYKCAANSSTETGGKCVPLLNKDKEVVTEKCGQRYKCKLNASMTGCVKGETTGQPVYADKYWLDSSGCLPVKKEEEKEE